VTAIERLVSHLAENARRFGERTAVRSYTEGVWSGTSWAEFAGMVAAAQLRARDVDGAALVALDNSTAALAAVLGLACAGVRLTVIEAEGTYLRDPASVCHTTGASTLVVPGTAPSAAGGYRVVRAEELVGHGEGVPAPVRADIEVAQATSGSTGEPRLARQTLGNLLRGAELYRQVYAVTEVDAITLTVPGAHSFGMVAGLFTAIETGATLRTFARFSPRAVRSALEEGTTVLLGTPLVYDLLNRAAAPARSRVRVALSSGGPLEEDVALRAAQRLGTPVLQAYGSTETGLIACQRPGSGPREPGGVGPAAPGVLVELGEDGDLAVRTGTMFLGYHGGGATLDERGYYRTGDVARLGPDGALHLLRRKDTFINVGGRKVNPVRVRRMLHAYPRLVEAAVYGVEAVGGQEIRAAVVLAAGGDVGSLLAHCRSRLAAYEIPHQVHVLETLPRNGMGKIDRSRLPQ
jgi:acyl-CoA synthetase (AMP-forming)/AMP-acid ligase II